MNLNYYYWYFKSALSKKFCKDIIELSKTKQKEIAITGEQKKVLDKNKNLSKKDLNNLKKKRDSNIVWMNDPWIYNEIYPYIHEANKNSGWNFQFDYSESCQFTKYGKDQHYDWHCDSWDNPYNNPKDLNFHNKIRKLSVTCSLSDQKDYKGGELEFDFRNKENGKPVIKTCKEILPIGSICVFPSFVWHRVRPVISGTRYSLVIWNLGYPFK
jgi:PKHD-type hydroxylase